MKDDKKLYIKFEKREKSVITKNESEKEELKNRILNFNAKGASSFEDALDWQNSERVDSKLPFSE
jgi:hypothetical protein